MLHQAENLSPAAPTMSRREKDDNYDDVVAVLDQRHRVIWCRDHYQWILQCRDKSTKTRATPRWRGWKYHRNRDGLVAVLASLKIAVEPDAMAKLLALPEWSDRDVAPSAINSEVIDQ